MPPRDLEKTDPAVRADAMAPGQLMHPTRVGLVSLGCAKNLVDSEKMLGKLVAAGCEVVGTPEDADVIIVNTCGFIADARKESVNTILEMSRLKQNGKRLIVTGCLVQRYAQELKKELPEVDAFLGVSGQDAIVGLAGLNHIGVSSDSEARRTHTGPAHFAYLKISEGCNLECSFCAIPGIRGPQRSRPIPELVAEAEELASTGVTELVLVAQDTTAYGRDLAERPRLAALIRALAPIEGLRWIRLNYLYPNHMSDELLETIAGEPKVCKYIDMPLQHSHPEVLTAMMRGGSATTHLRLLERIRALVPGAFVRSTFIVGFPNETIERFDSLPAFLRDAGLDHAGVFTYSREEGTSAWKLGDPVSEREKRRRRAVAMQTQQEVSVLNNTGRIGQVHEAVVEGVGRFYYICRVAGQAPEVDGMTRVRRAAAPGLQPGDYLTARITAAAAYDLEAEIVPHA